MKGKIMATKLTSFRINQQVKNMIGELSEREGRSARSSIHRRAILSFYKSSDRKVLPRLLITKRKDPMYVPRDVREQIYVDDEMQQMIDELVAVNDDCSQGVVVFHALLIYVTRELSK